MIRSMLRDREVATTIDSLVMTRDSLRAKGFTGNDCESAKNVVCQGITPDQNGMLLVPTHQEETHGTTHAVTFTVFINNQQGLANEDTLVQWARETVDRAIVHVHRLGD